MGKIGLKKNGVKGLVKKNLGENELGAKGGKPGRESTGHSCNTSAS